MESNIKKDGTLTQTTVIIPSFFILWNYLLLHLSRNFLN